MNEANFHTSSDMLLRVTEVLGADQKESGLWGDRNAPSSNMLCFIYPLPFCA